MKVFQFLLPMLVAVSCFGDGLRTNPKHPLILQSPELTAIFDPADGLPYKFESRLGRLWGEDAANKITAIVCHLRPRSYTSIQLSTKAANIIEGRIADFVFDTSEAGTPTVSFHVKYTLTGSSIVVTLDSVVEHNGYELIEVSLPNLVTVREEESGAWLAHGRHGGALVNLSDASSAHLPDDQYFGRISTVLPVGIVGYRNIECAMEVSGTMDGTETEVTGTAGRRHAHIGTVQTFRVHGGRSYDMNDGGPRVSGNQNTPNLLVGQTPRCRLDFLGDVDGNGTVDWLDGAKVLRQRMPPIPTHYFDDKFPYLIYGRYKPEPKPRTTFVQSEKLIHDVAMLTDSAPQIPFVSGWVYDGQDTGFPCEDKVNESMGGAAALKHLMQIGPKYNANVTINVNYDDAYRSCPTLTDDMLARRPDGQIWISRDWAGEHSYIMGMAKYMNGPGQHRVEETVHRYGIHDAMLIDALSWFTIRNDWDPQHPASGYRNLVDGRYRVLDQFRKLGVNVVSETLRYPMVGHMAESANGPSAAPDPFGGESIPLVPVIYRKSAIWGNDGSDPRHPDQNLFWNARPLYWYGNDTDRTEITDFYYLSVLPWMQVHNRDVETYRRVGYRSQIGLSGRSSVVIDWMLHQYSVTVDGVEIAKDFSTFCPLDKDRLAFYSRDARLLTAPLPGDWEAKTIAAKILYTDRRENLNVQVRDGQLSVAVPAGRPVIVYRNETIARRNLTTN